MINGRPGIARPFGVDVADALLGAGASFIVIRKEHRFGGLVATFWL
jgi:hypothetical protein